MRLLLLVLALSSSASAELLGTLSGAIKGVGDGRVATVACCGASKIGASTVLSAAATKLVEVMPGSTAVALVSGGDVAESAMAVASSDVVLLELRLSDLEADGPHGVAQLAPLLQRSLKLRALKPGKKLLVLVVSEDEEPSPRAELSALVSGALERLWASIRKPEDAAKLSLPDAFETTLHVVPAGAGADGAVAALRARFTDPSAPDYLFKEGAWSTQGSAALGTAKALSAAGPLPPATTARWGEVQTAHRSSAIAERAAKHFSKGLKALQKASEATALPDFGERLGSLIDDSIAKYSADAAQLGGSPTVATARSALLSQITRAATPTCRRQLKLLQVQSRERFMQKLAALKPSLKVEAELRTMVKEAATKFEADAKAALPPTLPLSYSFEKQAVVTSMAEAAKAQVELWRVQGLYLPLDGFKTPVDIGLHWLLPRPFGVDSRYDSISSRDKPKFRPRAAPMKVRAMDGYKARGLQDPKDMVFDAKMS